MIMLISLIGFGSYLLIDYSSKKKNIELTTVTFEDRVYTIPAGWIYRDYAEDGVKKLNIYNLDLNAQAIVALIEKEAVNYSINSKEDVASLEQFLKDNDWNIKNGVLKTYHGKKVAVYEYDDEILLAYLNSYDERLYAVRIIAGKFTDLGEEKFFDYDTLEKVIAILNTAKKVK